MFCPQINQQVKSRNANTQRGPAMTNCRPFPVRKRDSCWVVEGFCFFKVVVKWRNLAIWGCCGGVRRSCVRPPRDKDGVAARHAIHGVPCLTPRQPVSGYCGVQTPGQASLRARLGATSSATYLPLCRGLIPCSLFVAFVRADGGGALVWVSSAIKFSRWQEASGLTVWGRTISHRDDSGAVLNRAE